MAFYNPMSSGAVTIKDGGITLTPNVSSIDFEGSGVSGSNIGSDVTETISGGSSANFSPGEILTTSDQINFTFAHTPVSILSVWVKETGQSITNITDFTVSGTILTLTAIQPTWTIIASYVY